MNPLNRRTLCLITNRQNIKANNERARLDALIELCSRAALAGIDLIQIREKDLPTNQLCELVTKIVRATSATETAILVNDRVDVAMMCGAHGVHLRSDSLPVDAVRRLAGDDFIIGVSTHSATEAQTAGEMGASFALLGPIFDTPSKRAYGAPLGLDTLSEAVRTTACPVLALGGIDKDNIDEVLSCGAAGVAAIRLFAETEDLSGLVRYIKTTK